VKIHTTKHEGKIAVITGGSSGIGLATARRLALEGATVVVTGRRQPELDAAVQKIGRNASAVRGDIANLENLDVLVGVGAEKVFAQLIRSGAATALDDHGLAGRASCRAR